MNRYRCHKEVTAGKILSIDRIPEPTYLGPVCRGSAALGTACGHCERCKYHQSHGPMGEGFVISIEGGVRRIASQKWILNHKPVAGGYYVVYDDDYASFSPRLVFEAGYTRI